MSIYDNNKELLSTLGVEGNYSTDFEVRKAILNALGGDASICNSIYEVDLQILKIYQEGGGLGLPEQTKSVTYNTNGTYTVTPDEGYTLSNVDININVTTPIEVWKVPNGTKFTNSRWNSMPTELDFSNVTDFSSMFGSCSQLTTIPQLDTSNGTNFESMFYSCTNLAEAPQLNTSKCTNFKSMFGYCSNLTTIPQLDTSNGTNFFKMFDSCPNLITIEGKLDFSKGTSLNRAFSWASTLNKKLENVQFTGSINANIDFNPCPSLSYESVKSILTACSNTTNTDSKTLKFDRTLTDQNGELQSLIEICTSKGWTISGLTLE